MLPNSIDVSDSAFFEESEANNIPKANPENKNNVVNTSNESIFVFRNLSIAKIERIQAINDVQSDEIEKSKPKETPANET